jgi:hypothetical protein
MNGAEGRKSPSATIPVVKERSETWMCCPGRVPDNHWEAGNKRAEIKRGKGTPLVRKISSTFVILPNVPEKRRDMSNPSQNRVAQSESGEIRKPDAKKIVRSDEIVRVFRRGSIVSSSGRNKRRGSDARIVNVSGASSCFPRTAATREKRIIGQSFDKRAREWLSRLNGSSFFPERKFSTIEKIGRSNRMVRSKGSFIKVPDP